MSDPAGMALRRMVKAHKLIREARVMVVGVSAELWETVDKADNAVMDAIDVLNRAGRNR